MDVLEHVLGLLVLAVACFAISRMLDKWENDIDDD